ncbi:MAG: RnfH family protein [Methylococcaceae bacterium]|nr:RnfH family protein [Methylococcaceae bacterium]
MSDNLIDIEVACATPALQLIIPLQVVAETTVEQAITLSDILSRFPEIELSHRKLGIFGQACKADTILRKGDRVEIYRPLICDPKQARRDRAGK